MSQYILSNCLRICQRLICPVKVRWLTTKKHPVMNKDHKSLLSVQNFIVYLHVGNILDKLICFNEC